MASLVREMLDAGIHFGHHTSRWNPKMKPYIFGSRNSIHVIDIRETIKGLIRSQRFLTRLVSRGQDVLFVGTKRQAREAVQTQAQRCGMHWVTERWLGGMLTNFRTIRGRLKRLEELEALQQSPEWESGYSKKMQSTLSRELRKIRRNLDGVRRMSRLPGALVVIDVRKEVNALREARKLNIPTVCLIDTDSDPDLVSIPIPGNDDAMRAINLVATKLADAIEAGCKARPETSPQPEAQAEAGDDLQPRRRARRAAPNEGARPATAPEPAPIGAAAQPQPQPSNSEAPPAAS